MRPMLQLREVGCLLARDVVEMNLKDVLRKNMRECHESRKPETALIKTLRRHLFRDLVQKFANLTRLR